MYISEKFKEYIFVDEEHDVFKGQMVRYRFPNGYGASVIEGEQSYGLELAVLEFSESEYGATRIERTIREMFQVVSDAKMKEVGYFLFDMREIRQQLEVETGLDIEPVITDEVNKHINRAKEYKANYEKSS